VENLGPGHVVLRDHDQPIQAGRLHLQANLYFHINQSAMINRELLTEQLEESTTELVQHLLRFTDENFNIHPSEDQWSAADVAEHIVLLETKVNEALQQMVVSERPVDQKIAPIKKGLENHERRFAAPLFIHPTKGEKERDELIKRFKEQRLILQSIIRVADLEMTTVYKHPTIGDMTGIEWVYFNMYHTKRHQRQLENIAASVSA
jgi:hypothetical protein